MWAAIGRTVSREQLAAAVEAVDVTTRPAVDTHLDELLSRYSLVRRFLPALLATLRLEAAPSGADVLAAWEALRSLEGRRVVRADEVPLALATGPWAARIVGPDGVLNRPAYTFLVLERLREALRRRDIYAPLSQRWPIHERGCWTARSGTPPGRGLPQAWVTTSIHAASWPCSPRTSMPRTATSLAGSRTTAPCGSRPSRGTTGPC